MLFEDTLPVIIQLQLEPCLGGGLELKLDNLHHGLDKFNHDHRAQ